MKRLVLLVIALALPAWSFACGKERWSVKVGADKDAIHVNTTPVVATVNQLIQMAAPINPNVRATSRYVPTETTTYEVTATLTLIKAEADQDYHIVLTDDSGRTMIVESADPKCAARSVFKAQIKEVRAALDAVFGKLKGKVRTSKQVTVTGIGFFDKIHGQEGVAPNGIELHPILSVRFGQ